MRIPEGLSYVPDEKKLMLIANADTQRVTTAQKQGTRLAKLAAEGHLWKMRTRNIRRLMKQSRGVR